MSHRTTEDCPAYGVSPGDRYGRTVARLALSGLALSAHLDLRLQVETRRVEGMKGAIIIMSAQYLGTTCFSKQTSEVRWDNAMGIPLITSIQRERVRTDPYINYYIHCGPKSRKNREVHTPVSPTNRPAERPPPTVLRVQHRAQCCAGHTRARGALTYIRCYKY